MKHHSIHNPLLWLLLFMLPILYWADQHQDTQEIYSVQIPHEPEIWEKPKSKYIVKTHIVKRGDIFANILSNHGFTAQHIASIARSHYGKNIKKLIPGEEIKLLYKLNNDPAKVLYYPKPYYYYAYTKRENSYRFLSSRHREKLSTTVRTVAGSIKNSFYASITTHNLPLTIGQQIVDDIFGWDIDFTQDIRDGDKFVVIFEEHYIKDKFVGTGRVLAAEFINRRKRLQAFYFNDDNRRGYYNANGKSMRKSFLRNPLNVFRISSHFSSTRVHPIFKTVRPHLGTDYAAPRGTPVKSTANGRVTYAGRKKGYGNLITLKHYGKYETRYAHLHKIKHGVRTGRIVKQGEVIGYVGSTGYATGPHLHYEFRVHGKARNPVRTPIPKNYVLRGKIYNKFKQSIRKYLALLG